MTFYYWHWHSILPSADAVEGMYIISNSCFFDSLFCTSVIKYPSATAIIRKNLFFVIVMIPNCTNTISKHAKRLDLYSSRKLIKSGSSDLKNKQTCFFQKVSVLPSASFCCRRKSKKRSWNTLNMWLKLAQIEVIFFRISYRMCGQ